jgi:hypothetical protein
MELLDELPVPALDNTNAVDCQAILEVVLRAAAGSTSVNQVTHNAADTPDRKAVMDRLHLVEPDPLRAALNRLLGRLAMTCLDPDRSRTWRSTSWTTPTTASAPRPPASCAR